MEVALRRKVLYSMSRLLLCFCSALLQSLGEGMLTDDCVHGYHHNHYYRFHYHHHNSSLSSLPSSSSHPIILTGKKHFGAVTVQLLSICVDFMKSLGGGANSTETSQAVADVLFASDVSLLFTKDMLDLVQVNGIVMRMIVMMMMRRWMMMMMMMMMIKMMMIKMVMIRLMMIKMMIVMTKVRRRKMVL